MQHLPKTLKTILNALAMQNVGDYLSDEDKQANLAKALADIEQEKQADNAANIDLSVPSNIALHTK